MKPTLIIILLLSTRSLFGDQKTPPDLLAKLDQLNHEVVALKTQQATAASESANLGKEERQLLRTADLLRDDFKRLGKDIQKDVDESRDHASQKASHDANQCTFPEGHPENCAAYNAEAKRLDEWARRLNEDKKLLKMRSSGLDEARENLNKGTLDWFARKKSNNATLNDLEAKEKAAVEKAKRMTMDDGFLRIPRLRRLMSEHCANLSEVGTQAALEMASQCLQRVFDGASH